MYYGEWEEISDKISSENVNQGDMLDEIKEELRIGYYKVYNE